MISHSRHVTGNRVVRMNLANLPGEDDETGEKLINIGALEFAPGSFTALNSCLPNNWSPLRAQLAPLTS